MKRVVGLVAGILVLVAPPVCRAGVVAGFVENRGQVDPRVLYYMEGAAATVYVTAQALVFDLRAPASADDAPVAAGCAVHARLGAEGASSRIEARGRLRARCNFLRGHDPLRWRTGVPVYREVVWREAWLGVDLILTARDGALAYAAVATEGATPPAADFRCEGAAAIVRLGDAAIALETPAGRLVQSRGTDGTGAFLLAGAEAAGAARAADKNDPAALAWSTFLGGAGEDVGNGLALDASDCPVVTGTAWSADFPATVGAYDISYNEARDVIVAKFSSTGSELLWSTFLGGASNDYGYAIALDADGNAVVTGATRSTDFPTTPGAFDPSFNGSSNENAFVAKLSSDGSALLWSTFLGRYAAAYAVALDVTEGPVLAGMTSSSLFPTTAGAYDTAHNGGRDVFVAKFSSTGSELIWSTFLGGTTDDWGLALALDSSGDPVFAGYTWSSNFPTTAGAFDQTWNGANTDAFVARLSSTGSELLWSTYLGGSSTDDGYALALDAAGNPIVTGRTASANFPTTPGAFDTDHDDSYDVFVTKLSGTGSELLWSTFLGGSSAEEGRAILVDPTGNPVLTGFTSSNDFPATPDAFDTGHNLSNDAFVVRLSDTGSELLHGTFLGGSSIDSGNALALDASRRAVVAGQTQTTTTNFLPTTAGAYDTSHNGAIDVFVAKLDIGGAATDVTEPASPAALVRASPNPSDGRVVIHYALAQPSAVKLGVYDLRGRLVAPLASAMRDAGPHSATWDGCDPLGRRAAAGVYFVRLQAGGRVIQERVVLLR